MSDAVNVRWEPVLRRTSPGGGVISHRSLESDVSDILIRAFADLAFRDLPPPTSDWEYVERAHTYRDTRTGRFMSATERAELREEVAARQQERMAAVARQLLDGEIDVKQFQSRMTALVKAAHTQQFAFGKGGIHAVTNDDRTAIATTVDSQNAYLHKFSQAIAAGDLSEAQIRARTTLYANAAGASFETGHVASYGMPDLPQVPGDGQTACRVNCRCSLEIEETPDAWEVTWVLDGGEHCVDCVLLSAVWSPKIIEKPEPEEE